MKINCPLHGDDDVCEQPMEVILSADHPGTRHEPGDGPGLLSVDGFCHHARQFNSGDLPEADLDYLLEYAVNEEYERCQEQMR